MDSTVSQQRSVFIMDQAPCLCLLDFCHPGVDLLDTALPSGNSLLCISYIVHKKFP